MERGFVTKTMVVTHPGTIETPADA